MRYFLLKTWTFLVLCTIGVSAHAQAPVVANLIEQIHAGEAIYRDDLVADAVQRLYRIAPGHPAGLAAQLREAVRLDQIDKARQLLEHLRKSAPGSAMAIQGDALMRLTTPKAVEILTRARLYAAAGRPQDARRTYDEVFQGVYPTHDLALEYWQFRAREPESRELAIGKLAELLSVYSRQAGVLSALANLKFADGAPAQALKYLHEMARQPIHRDAAANREYEYLATLPPSEASVADWTSFTRRYPDLEAGRRASEKLAQHAALVGDPAWQGGQRALAAVERGESTKALAPLLVAIKSYPDDAELYGALGMAYMRLGNRMKALTYFKLAQSKEERIDRASRWVSLIQSTDYWLLLQNAALAAEKKDWRRAQDMYGQAHRKDPGDIHALIGLGDAAMGLQQRDLAWKYIQQAFRKAPADQATQRALGRYLESESPEFALSVIDRLPESDKRHLSSLRRTYEVAMLIGRADRAQALSQWSDVIAALTEAQKINLADPWLSYRLASALRSAKLGPEASRAYERHLQGHRGNAVSHYAHALLLESSDEWQQALDSLHEVAMASWSGEMVQLEGRLKIRQRIARATALYDAGNRQAGIAALETAPETTETRMQVASWALDNADYPKALFNYAAILRQDPQNTDAWLGQLEAWVGQGKTEAVHSALSRRELALAPHDANGMRRWAALWKAAGEPDRASVILNDALKNVTGPEPLLLRDVARITAPVDPQAALGHYERAMHDSGLLPARTEDVRSNTVRFTEATRPQLNDDWLARSIRGEAAALYQRENPTLTLSTDAWMRRDGTPGLSELGANTTIVQMDFPLRSGTAFIRADHVRVNAGTFETESDGSHTTRFGTCSFSAQNDSGQLQSLPGCTSDLTQKATGTSFAVGWKGERLSFDLGRTPQGFPVQNWTGGLTYKGDLNGIGWSLTGSRRPMSNSLLSFAGTRDPRTGTLWGGVLATGLSLGLSWDQGEADGVWADLSHHKLTGHNVENNQRTRLMAGYYRRLINLPNETLTAGVNLMHWRYQKDLGEYTLGQGGYYSPQRYSSVSLPVGYARRSSNWSFAIEGSISASASSSNDTSYYPIPGLVAQPANALQQMGVGQQALMAANRLPGSSGGGFGYSVRGMVERRLDNHWVLGAGFDLQHGRDYAPSRFMLYLRYTVKPWQGSLALSPSGLSPYADFK